MRKKNRNESVFVHWMSRGSRQVRRLYTPRFAKGLPKRFSFDVVIDMVFTKCIRILNEAPIPLHDLPQAQVKAALVACELAGSEPHHAELMRLLDIPERNHAGGRKQTLYQFKHGLKLLFGDDLYSRAVGRGKNERYAFRGIGWSFCCQRLHEDIRETDWFTNREDP